MGISGSVNYSGSLPCLRTLGSGCGIVAAALWGGRSGPAGRESGQNKDVCLFLWRSMSSLCVSIKTRQLWTEGGGAPGGGPAGPPEVEKLKTWRTRPFVREAFREFQWKLAFANLGNYRNYVFTLDHFSGGVCSRRGEEERCRTGMEIRDIFIKAVAP